MAGDPQVASVSLSRSCSGLPKTIYHMLDLRRAELVSRNLGDTYILLDLSHTEMAHH